LVLRLLNGPGPLADAASGFGDPFDIAHACAHLADLPLADSWDAPHLPYVRPALPCRDAWNPPESLPDLLTGRAVSLLDDGVVALLGTSRLSAAEEAVRAARPGDRVTVAVVTADPAETGRLVRLRIGELMQSLRCAFPPGAGPRLQLVLDEHGLLTSAMGVTEADDATEYAVRVQHGTLIARANGRGAGHAAAVAVAVADARTTTSEAAT
jgi:hypothetical protein